MRLYTLTGETQVADPEHGTFTAAADGAFEFPAGLAAKMHSFHKDGKPAWEDDAEREARLVAEELERFRDPATLLAEVRKMSEGQGALAEVLKNMLAAAQAPTSAPQPEPTQPTDPPAATVKASPRARKTAAAKSANAG